MEIKQELVAPLLITIFVIITSFIYLYNLNVSMYSAQGAITTQEIESPYPEIDYYTNPNIQIQSAMISFQDYAINHPDEFDYLCTSGGFINERNSELKQISDTIVSMRVIDPQTGDKATTPDEAGISCFSNPQKWVLFVPFNVPDESSQLQYYCVDSTGAQDMLKADSDAMQCVQPV